MATDADLDAEHDALAKEHAALEAEHARLVQTPKDVAGHVAHSEHLRAHLERLHRYMKARGYRVPG